ncbi:MAG: hypothetical protein HC903_31000 [Methylacidiphilales bacterium]|nr:hypothetical protein [Candidatus Methylacidiphilales bacterium]NJR18930.1 hypothetical protein [Calothrix sp. CSU_2_0]
MYIPWEYFLSQRHPIKAIEHVSTPEKVPLCPSQIQNCYLWHWDFGGKLHKTPLDMSNLMKSSTNLSKW